MASLGCKPAAACIRVCFLFVCVCVCVRYLQGLDQLLSARDVGNVDGGAESVQHLHFLEDVFATRGADDQ